MSVHYKFKSTLDYDTITFDGLHISVADLKKAILQQKRLSKITDFDLQIINAQTKEEYQHESSLIPKNTSLIISRVPMANQTLKKSWDTSSRPVQPKIVSKVDSADFDLSKMEGSEEDKIQAMMMQSTAEYDPKSYQKIRGYSQAGEVPSTYRCNKCKKGGHWIKNCPYIISKEHTVEKRTTGIPKSFRDKDDRALLIDNQETIVEDDKKQEIPEDLVCSICNDLFVDAVMIPCCGSSFCDDCVRTALLESEDNECPDCKEKGSSPGSLIPNRFLRNSVNGFKNRTGYKGSSQAKKEVSQLEQGALVKKPSEKEPNNETGEEKVASEIESNEKQEESVKNSPQTLVQSKEDVSKEEGIECRDKTANAAVSPSHEDSDYEDNIVVTVPSASDTRTEKYLSRRHASHPKPPGIEQSSPKSKHQASPYHQENSSYKPSEHHGIPAKEWEHISQDKARETAEIATNEHFTYENNRAMPSSKTMQENVQPPGANHIPVPVYPHQSYDMQQQRPIRPINMHPGFHNHLHRPPLYPHPNMPPHHPPHQMRLPLPPINSYDTAYNPIGNVAPGYQRFPSTMPNRFSYPIRDTETANQMRPYNNIASVYEEVAAKVGVGIIDDPLEAFNRIMKEKEKKKDERRSPDRRRRSKDRHIRGSFRISPYNARTKDHIFYDKRGRSRERDNERRWPRYGKGMDKERERERDRERDKDQGYRTRRSKSFERASRSRSHSPPNKRYRSPQNTKTISTHDKHQHQHQHQHQHHYHISKFRSEELQEDTYERQRREAGRSLTTSSKSLDSRGENRQQIDHEDKNLDVRRPYNINDENSEPPPPGFEVQSSRNPFHTNNSSSFPPSIRERDRSLRNNTPDLYEKCVSQDMEDNNLYNIVNKSDTRPKSRSGTRSRSRSQSILRANEKRRKVHRSTTPKGKPGDGRVKRDKDNILSNRSHSHMKQKSEERHIKKDKELNEHEPKRGSMTPPRQKDHASDHQQTSSETDHKDKSDSKRSEKKLKDRKKKRREKSERKKVKKEKKSRKERHRIKSEEKDNVNDDVKDKCNASANSAESEQKDVPETENISKREEASGAGDLKDEIISNPLQAKEENGLLTAQAERSHKNQPALAENDEKTPTSADIKCFDAILDIHEYETDFDDNNFKLQDVANKLVPETSKWEIEDQACTTTQLGADKLDNSQTQLPADNKVTSDVIVRAEKAIFARAINAIRPIEVRTKSVSKERSTKCFTDDHENIRNIQITLPVNINKDRSIEVKTENNEKKKSIKDRLGSKVSQPVYSQFGDSRRDSDHTFKSGVATSDRNLEGERNRDRRRKCSTDNKESSKKSESDKNVRERHGRDNDRSNEKERDHYRGREKESARHREKDIADKDRNREDGKGRERVRERHGHTSEADSSRRHSKSNDHKASKTDKTHYTTQHRDYDSSCVGQKKRNLSSTNSESDDEDHKRKLSKSEKKSRKRSESLDSESGKKTNKKRSKSDKKKKKKSKK